MRQWQDASEEEKRVCTAISQGTHAYHACRRRTPLPQQAPQAIQDVRAADSAIVPRRPAVVPQADVLYHCYHNSSVPQLEDTALQAAQRQSCEDALANEVPISAMFYDSYFAGTGLFSTKTGRGEASENFRERVSGAKKLNPDIEGFPS